MGHQPNYLWGPAGWANDGKTESPIMNAFLVSVILHKHFTMLSTEGCSIISEFKMISATVSTKETMFTSHLQLQLHAAMCTSSRDLV